jgi:formamidase
MVLLLTEQQGLSRDDAYSLMSVAADFSVTQVVDSRQGIHCKIPRSIFPPKKKPRA